MSLATPLAGATPASYALTAAKYAVETAYHDRRAHVVSAADISNAFANPSLVNGSPMLEVNLGELPGQPRMILLFSSTTDKFTCVYFPNKINATPSIVACSSRAAAAQKVPLAKKPTFTADQGGTVEFAAKWTAGTTTLTLDICVLFPKTAYGIPVEVNC